MPAYHHRAFDPSLPYPALVKDCDLLMVAIWGQYGSIQTYLDQWFMQGTDTDCRALAWSSGVLAWMNYGQVGVEGGAPLTFSDQGSAPYAESALTVPVILGRQVTLWGLSFFLPVAAAWDMSYIFANNMLSVCTTRDVWGYSKTLGTVKQAAGANSSEIHRVRTDVLDTLGPSQVWQRRQLYALRRAQGLNPMAPMPVGSSSPPSASPLAPPFSGPGDLVRLALDHQGGHVWVDDPARPVDPEVIHRLPPVELGQPIGPDGPLAEPPAGRSVWERGPGLPGVPADVALRARLEEGKAAGAALLTVPFSSVLPDIPTRVIGLKQERTCTDPALAEHRRLTLGSLVAVDPVVTAVEGPGTWRFVLTRNPDSHPMATDLGIKTQDSLLAMRMKCHMRVEAAQVEWTTT